MNKDVYKKIALSTTLLLSDPLIANETPIDLKSDDFKVFTQIAEDYIKENIARSSIFSKREFGTGYTSFDNNNFPKVGFVGYEILNLNGKIELIKLQLFKSANGWAIVNKLDSNKIHEANPTFVHKTDHARTINQRESKVSTAIKLEKWLNDENIINDVRSTNISCYTSKELTKASCHSIYGLKIDNEVQCMTKSYLLLKQDNLWVVDSEINFDQKVDYTSGKLEKAKAPYKHCT